MSALRWMLPVLGLLSACHTEVDPIVDFPPIATPPVDTQPLEIGPLSHALRPLPPISGGTLATGRIGFDEVAVASDPEHDQVWILDPKQDQPRGKISFPERAEPGRVVIAGEQAFVVLRGTGELAQIDIPTAKLVARRSLCVAPRGVDVDVEANLLVVVCMDGSLHQLEASTLNPIATYQLDRDLRDVVIQGEEILVSRFRSAEILVLQKDGTQRDRKTPGAQRLSNFGQNGTEEILSTPSVAWRMLRSPDGGALVVHQRGTDSDVPVSQPGGYGSTSCGGIVQSAVSSISKGQLHSSGSYALGLAVDIAVNRQGRVVLALPSPPDNPGPLSPQVAGEQALPPPCGDNSSRTILFDGPKTGVSWISGEPTSGVRAVAVAFSPDETLLYQTREPHGVQWGKRFIAFGGDAEVRDTGYQIFHMASSAGLACASCHPEGGDDGRVWRFQETGPRRTQPLQGGLRGSEPFHWSGDINDFSNLMDDVFTRRMSGAKASKEQANALLDWIDRVPAPPPARSSQDEAVLRGAALFTDAQVGCASCHQGPRLAGQDTVDVGTGEPFQVPTLRGLSYRAPFLHNGCAQDLTERFGPCGGGDQHGKTSHLSQAQIQDLVAYLESL